MDAPAQIDAGHAADAAEEETGHEADIGAEPPAGPSANRHPDEDTDLSHRRPSPSDGQSDPSLPISFMI